MTSSEQENQARKNRLEELMLEQEEAMRRVVELKQQVRRLQNQGGSQ